MVRRFRILASAVALAAAALGLSITSGESQAQNWPQRPIKVIVPFAPGGAVDITARIIQEQMAKILGTTMIVENRAGGGGLPASEALVRAEPDGYTIAVVSASFASNAVVQTNLSFDVINDITPISLAVINTVLILVPADSRFKTLKDMIDEAKANPDKLTYGSVGFGSAMHFAGELLNSRAGIKMVHVPYRGAAPMLNDLLAGQLPVGIIGIGPTLSSVRAGKLRALAITTAKRSRILPDIPTVAELGYPGYQSAEWFALIAPKGVPPAIQSRLHAAFMTAIELPEVKTRLEQIGLEPTSSTPAGLKDFLADEVKRLRTTADQTKMLETAK